MPSAAASGKNILTGSIIPAFATPFWSTGCGSTQTPGRRGDGSAAQHFVGTHDFACVRSVGTETKTTVRTVHYFAITREGDMISCRVCADGFLYNMVRAMVGTCVYASEGKLSPDDIPGLLEGRNRTDAGPTAPPQGLYMTNLWYPVPNLP